MTKSVLAIIPARGGSKGVVKKNIRDVAGQPLIYWTIKASQESQLITKYFISSDDDDILDAALHFGAPIIKRPKLLAGDTTPMIPVLQHLCREVERGFGDFDYVLLLQPTAPMRTAKHIDSAIETLLKNPDRKSLISVYQVDDCHPSRMYHMEDDRLIKYASEPEGSLRQDLTPVYHRNGAVYLCERNLLMEEDRLYCDSPVGFIMKKSESLNIDDEHDLAVADFFMKERTGTGVIESGKR